MEISEILGQMERNNGRFARAAVMEAIARRDEIIPELLRILEDVADDPESYAEDASNMALTYAMFLLAQFRETRAYPLLVRIFSVPGEMPFDLVGDTVTEHLGAILASVSGGDTGGMAALIENEEANEYVRAAAMKGLLTLMAMGRRSRDEIMAYFTSLFHKFERRWSYAWDELVCCCADLCPEEVLDEIRQAYKEGLVDPGVIGPNEVEEAISLGKEKALERLSRSRLHPIDDVAREMEWWACFDHEPRRRQRWEMPRVARPPEEPRQPKIGRNERCPCGSGKKFKKCCGAAKA